jgi:hypothetical protein
MGPELSPSAAVLCSQSIKYTMTKVGKSDGEGTFAGTAASDGNAPIPAVPEAAVELQGSRLPFAARATSPARDPRATLRGCARTGSDPDAAG